MADFVLIDLESEATFTFRYFPNEIETTRRTNWREQDTTTGTKPLFYANRDGERIRIDDLWLDNTESARSITDDLKDLELLTEEKEKTGMPPALLATWGDEKHRCVLENVTATRTFFDNDGRPTRARVSLDLIELQPEGEATTVRVTEGP